MISFIVCIIDQDLLSLRMIPITGHLINHVSLRFQKSIKVNDNAYWRQMSVVFAGENYNFTVVKSDNLCEDFDKFTTSTR